MKILLIEQTTPIRDFLSDLFTKLGHDVTSANCVEQGITLLQSGLCADVIVSCLGYPVLVGLQVLDHLHAQQADTPLIYIISGKDPAIGRIVERFGAYDLCDKSEPELLLASLARVSANAA